jgi:hypothetical protein
MISCLTDTIGLIGCRTSSPASGLFVNSLPGISFKSLEYLADSEQRNYIGVWDDVNVRAHARLSIMVAKELSNRYKLATVSDSIDIGQVIDTTSTTTAAAEYRGLHFDLDFQYGTGSDNRSSALQSHFVKTLPFYSPAVKTPATIKIYDVDRDTVLDTLTQNLSIGWNTITVNESYNCRRLFIGVDSTTFSSVELDIANSGCCSSDECGAYIQGAYMTIGAACSTLIKGDNSFGLSAIYGVRCKYDNIICNNPDVFYETFWYLLGSELMQERITTERINQFTVNRKEAQELKAFYDAEAQKNLEHSIYGTNISLSDCCIDCDEQITVRETNNFY